MAGEVAAEVPELQDHPRGDDHRQQDQDRMDEAEQDDGGEEAEDDRGEGVEVGEGEVGEVAAVLDQLDLVGVLRALQVLEAGGRRRDGHQLLLDGLAGALGQVGLEEAGEILDQGAGSDQGQVAHSDAQGPTGVAARQSVDHQLGDQAGERAEHPEQGGRHEQRHRLPPGRAEGQAQDDPVDPHRAPEGVARPSQLVTIRHVLACSIVTSCPGRAHSTLPVTR